MKIAIVLACAGRGERLGRREDKAFVKIGDKPMFYYSYKIFCSFKEVVRICIVARRKYFSLIKSITNGDKKVTVIEGGKRRQDSVYRGIETVKDEDIDSIIIHDGARPFIDRKIIKKTIDALRRFPAVVLGVPARDTLKEVKRGYIKRTINRENIYLIQTPQGFRKDLIVEGYRKFVKIKKVYDDAQIVELLNRRVKVIRGDYKNIKITYPEDLEIASCCLGRI